ncbi:MAG: proteasome-type protease [Spirulinaceae cyanobacterium RM2_2_10]|nr:proteasome-type protease [Spirulinaceae cyanobacterium SM2_1_0]NJO19330.1 proteasome-type protease [Spirulinaceae cyanobacterium RM2_2_10]
MTYCVGILTESGLVVAADSRTNAGVDYISAYRKLFDYSQPGKRALLLCTSGNLAITQSVLTSLDRDLAGAAETNLHSLPTMYEVARYIGDKIRAIQDLDRPWLERDNIDFQCSILLGGQLPGEAPKLYLIYAQGNCIQATQETPFLQIGENKYGKPILDRTLTFETPLDAVAKCALLSIDSTMKSNISVGPPVNLVMYQRDSFVVRHRLQLRLGTPYLAKIRKLWEEHLRQAFDAMPNIEWEQIDDAEDVFID